MRVSVLPFTRLSHAHDVSRKTQHLQESPHNMTYAESITPKSTTKKDSESE